MTIDVRTYAVTVKSRLALAALTVVALGVGAVVVTVGLALIAALVAGGVVLGTGYAVLRRLRVRPAAPLVRHPGMREVFPEDRAGPRDALPPGREVFPEEPL